ncbi:helix-turn-helix domain-containing protein [Noviluteimonas gilva]|uniref:HTH cro/C1-type domain-containing protein n=1 Tax=Noviluteimonas gilva TaxID=2682097 RepID=A0A7C9LI07_9GAMM|nr:hypothetical protein [Lysobacter gilvus]MUV13559.1 hypothetical protein [Lysobacter gilvus]
MRLKTAIHSSGMTQAELARQAKTYPANLSQMVNDNIRPNATTLARMLRAMPAIDARWLITGEHETQYTITEAGIQALRESKAGGE